jgi:hypothetical protein
MKEVLMSLSYSALRLISEALPETCGFAEIRNIFETFIIGPFLEEV